jgi:DNA-binding transcriptional MerR regulator
MTTIGEVASELGISTASIRLYEAKGLIPKQSRTITGWRNYTVADVKAIKNAISQRHGKGVKTWG